MRKTLRLSLASLGLAALAYPLYSADAPSSGREFTAINIEYRGSKVWVPSTFIVKRGERVKITLINNAPSGVHGWALDEFGVKVHVDNAEKGNKKVVEFTADKAGLFRTYCDMHPAHIGGQLLVLE